MKLISTILFFIISRSCFSQTDSSAVSDENFIKEGIYVSHSDFRKGKVISKSEIITQLDTNALDFFSKLLERSYVVVKTGESTTTLVCSSFWGYGQNKTLYLNANKNYYRVPVFGNISFLAVMVDAVAYNGAGIDPFFGPTISNPQRVKELKNFIMSIYNGVLIDNSPKNLLELIKHDKLLFDEYNKLSYSKQKNQIGRFVRLYNEKYRLFLIN